MSNLNSVLSFLGKAAEELVPQLVPGSGALIGAAHALSSAFHTVKDANGGQAPAEAEAAHKALFQKVQAHAEGTLGRLEGG